MNNYKNIVGIKFAQAEQPKFTEKKGKKYIEFGEKNNYPDYLLALYKESPKHGAIIKGKVNYIFGKGFKDVPVSANSRGETFNHLFKKVVIDDEIFSGYYLQIIYNKLGKVKDIFHLEYKKVRTNKDKTKFFVKNDWDDNREEIREYNSFNPATYLKSSYTQVLFVSQYNPEGSVYPLPSYFQGLNYVESDVQVSRHILGNAKDGFVATTLISLNNGAPQEEEKAQVEKDLKKKFTGSEGDRMVIMFNPSKDNESTITPLSQTMLTKEDFTNINNLIQQEIFAAHQITSPTLFGIKTEGQLGARNEITDAYEIFNNTYINERQQAHEETFNFLFKLKGVQQEIKITPVQPLGFTLKEELLPKVLPREYFLDEMGVDQKYYGLPPAEGGAAPAAPIGQPGAPAGMSNQILTNLTGRQFQGVMRIVNKFVKGQLTREQASLMLKSGFQFTDDDIETFLVEPSMEFASQEEIDFALIEQFGQVGESEADFEILESNPAREAEYFAEVKELSQLESNVVNLIRKDKRITPEVIATTLKRSVKVVTEVLRTLATDGLLTETPTQMGEDTIVEREVKPNFDAPRASTTDILLRYRYEGPEDSRNRPFCAKLMGLKRIYSRSDIETISERLGYSVWDRRGGWFTQPDGNHRPYCRHEWRSVIVKRKK